MRTKTIRRLEELGYKVYFRYQLGTEVFTQARNIRGKFPPGGKVNCIIEKQDIKVTSTEFTNTLTSDLVSYCGTAICNVIDPFIPRIGRAIAFKRTLELVPEFNEDNKNDRNNN